MIGNSHQNLRIAIVVGLVVFVVIMLVYYLTSPDITIKKYNTIPQKSERNCETGSICTYIMNRTGFSDSQLITLTETETSWILKGLCIDTAGESLARHDAEISIGSPVPLHSDPSDNFNPNYCRDMVIFEKSKWTRENKVITDSVQIQCITTPCDPVIQNFEANIFKIMGTTLPSMNIIGG